jgi:DNA end-binding protein Ku
MGRVKKTAQKKRKDARPKDLPFHAFWSGSLSFGLVNVPVLVFPATRHSGIHLRMIGPGGAPLLRRYYCPRDESRVPADELIKGYELDDGNYIVVSDKELEDLEPQKTREIDLRQFVDLNEVGPAFLERGYYLTPNREATKAYRLLADAMEKSRRAGIATFVMRDREYLVAIFAKNGILCAETLRFHDELRDPQTIGLPEPTTAPRQRVAAFERSVDALAARTIPHEELVDHDTRNLRALIDKKKRTGKDQIRMTNEDVAVADEEGGDIDLLDVIRHSLRHASAKRVIRQKRPAPSHNGLSATSKTVRGGRPAPKTRTRRRT